MPPFARLGLSPRKRWTEAEINRAPRKAEVYFERALDVARGQQAKSCEPSVAMSLARQSRDQGKAQQARELLEGGLRRGSTRAI